MQNQLMSSLKDMANEEDKDVSFYAQKALYGN
jgi:hypothetical protein